MLVSSRSSVWVLWVSIAPPLGLEWYKLTSPPKKKTHFKHHKICVLHTHTQLLKFIVSYLYHKYSLTIFALNYINDWLSVAEWSLYLTALIIPCFPLSFILFFITWNYQFLKLSFVLLLLLTLEFVLTMFILREVIFCTTAITSFGICFHWVEKK